MAGAPTRVGPKYQVTIPKRVREAIGLKVGDLVEASVDGGYIVLKPKVLVDRDTAPSAGPRAPTRRPGSPSR